MPTHSSSASRHAANQVAPRRTALVRRLDMNQPPPRVMDKREACPRRALEAAQAADGASFAALSRMIGRPDHYLSRFVRDGHPKALTADEHRYLAMFFGVDERGLGVRDLWSHADG